MDSPTSKPGWRSSEFWLTVLVIVGTAALVALGKDPSVFVAGAGLASGGYSMGRGKTKSGGAS